VRTLGLAALFLIIAGLSALCFTLLFYADAGLHQRSYEREFERLQQGATPAESPVVGRLEIPRLGVSTMVLEGIDDDTLRRAVGRIPGTAVPGQVGNIGVAGHRDTFFWPLQRIRKNDTIRLTTHSATHHYQVESMMIVGPRDVRVLKPTRRPVLTLVTCYPFDFVGRAPRRFVVQARETTGAL